MEIIIARDDQGEGNIAFQINNYIKIFQQMNWDF
jgi:hypothetical protein